MGKRTGAGREDRARSGRKKGRRARIETSAGGVVFRRAGSGEIVFLLIRDPYGNWGLPKGHLEEGETPEQAAVREVAEEAGLSELTSRGELQTIDWYFRDKERLIHKFCHFFLLESPRGEARPQREEGISACVWLPLAQAVEAITYDNAREVLRAAGERLGAALNDASRPQ